MKPTSPTEQLLDDVLAESATPEFRAVLLEETLQQVRRRRHGRLRNRAFVAAGLCCAALLLVLKSRVPSSQRSLAETTPSQALAVKLVSSQPWPASRTVETSPASVGVVSSAPGVVPVLDTARERKPFSEVGDPELLSLVAGRPIALVQQPGQPPELLFLNAEDQRGFPVP
ncbi:MAG: hypothetical protein HZA90_25510 [Verrucomicrobia bacterium]|nr:hypothetical protein [Verrucomicrobiota bacterium]